MIIEEKSMPLPPPPPYVPANGNGGGLPPFPHCRPAMTLSTLPPHLLLQIVHMTFPQTSKFDEGKGGEAAEDPLLALNQSETRQSCIVHRMHASFAPANPANLRLGTIQRETATLDLFIAVKVREDVWADDSELHLERDESFKDLFDLAQPRARLEDLIRVYGLREGVVSIDSLTAPAYSGSGNTSPSPTSGGVPPAAAEPDYAPLSQWEGEASDEVAQAGAAPLR
ncbi:hypothetical protein MSAN_01169800 [Mycena sanguinolenta]|uniref:Uncharacterized protein n=1 Tax=Mycena sanguinolenta TaxID=230812 RepID=A0A8H6YP10_9AGAR|nr:hypothetical protein MSAN_01169800 [Mycena sanguinolenta]